MFKIRRKSDGLIINSHTELGEIEPCLSDIFMRMDGSVTFVYIGTFEEEYKEMDKEKYELIMTGLDSSIG